jgi:hypothetical protein
VTKPDPVAVAQRLAESFAEFFPHWLPFDVMKDFRLQVLTTKEGDPYLAREVWFDKEPGDLQVDHTQEPRKVTWHPVTGPNAAQIDPQYIAVFPAILARAAAALDLWRTKQMGPWTEKADKVARMLGITFEPATSSNQLIADDAQLLAACEQLGKPIDPQVWLEVVNRSLLHQADIANVDAAIDCLQETLVEGGAEGRKPRIDGQLYRLSDGKLEILWAGEAQQVKKLSTLSQAGIARRSEKILQDFKVAPMQREVA